MTSALPETEIARLGQIEVEYRYRPGTSGHAVLVLPGSHMPAACRFGEESFNSAGHGVLVVSRPGYGQTPLDAGPTIPEFLPRLARLCRELEISRVSAAGVSIGARTALALAAGHPQLVDRVVLLCPVSFAPWPHPRSRLSTVAYSPPVERLAWSVVHRLLRRDPARYLPALVRRLSTLPGPEAVRRLGDDRQRLVDFLLACRSGRGYRNDMTLARDVTEAVRQPVLVLGTRYDAAVGFEHARRLAADLSHATLVEVGTPTHLLWLGENAGRTAAAIGQFLAP